jgi:DNA-binding transcriptional ArsR family regulator
MPALYYRPGQTAPVFTGMTSNDRKYKIMLSTLFRSKTLQKLLSHVFSDTDAVFYVRELAGLIKEDPGNLSRELSRLEKDGLMVSVKKGSLKLFSLNKDYPLYKELKQIMIKQHSLSKIKSREQQLEMPFEGAARRVNRNDKPMFHKENS